MSEALVGRQAIFDRELGVHAYELLFRGGTIDPEDPRSGDRATSQVIVNMLTEIGLKTLVSNKKAYINLTRSFIVGEHALLVNPKDVVLEILEGISAEPEVLEGIARLKARGFTIALDDFVLDDDSERFLELADLVKLDVLDESEQETRANVEALRPYGVDLLAEKIETREQYAWCREMGFRYFQGFFLERPSIVRKRSIDPQKLTLLTLLNELYSPSFNFQNAEEIVKQDVGLCYRLLRHINSALFGMPRQISSIRETLVYLGVQNVQNLTSLFLLAADDETPREMIVTAMMRARMCESLGRAIHDTRYSQYFVVGLFSTIDALMEAPMEEILTKLPLTKEQKEALNDGDGPMAEALRAVIAYEHADWDNVSCFDLPVDQIQELYLEALRWAQVVSEQGSRQAA